MEQRNNGGTFGIPLNSGTGEHQRNNGTTKQYREISPIQNDDILSGFFLYIAFPFQSLYNCTLETLQLILVLYGSVVPGFSTGVTLVFGQYFKVFRCCCGVFRCSAGVLPFCQCSVFSTLMGLSCSSGIPCSVVLCCNVPGFIVCRLKQIIFIYCYINLYSLDFIKHSNAYGKFQLFMVLFYIMVIPHVLVY